MPMRLTSGLVWAGYSSNAHQDSRQERHHAIGFGSTFKTGPAMSRLQPLQAAICRLPEVLTLGFLVVIADFAVVGKVQTLDLLFGAGTQTDNRFHDES